MTLPELFLLLLCCASENTGPGCFLWFRVGVGENKMPCSSVFPLVLKPQVSYSSSFCLSEFPFACLLRYYCTYPGKQREIKSTPSCLV
jgi:hypothetical protein